MDAGCHHAPDPSPLRSTRKGYDSAPAVPVPSSPAGVPPSYADLTRILAESFDPVFYLARNPDVAAAGMDPLQHYITTGWQEGRDPNRWFDTAYYRANTPGVNAAGLNPLWHFLAQGRAQGRPPLRRHAAERAALQQAAPPPGPGQPLPEQPHLTVDGLRQALAPRLASAVGVTLSVSHDRYTHSIGGVQILVSDEQLAFNARGEAYLHLAPATPRLCLAPEDEAPFLIHVTLDGIHLGVTTYDDLAAVLAGLRPQRPAPRRLILHCLLGHQAAAMPMLRDALQPHHAVFWLNDYEAVCSGYNLLRNDVAFCGAPPPDSAACRVCIHGSARAGHLRQVAALFSAIPMHVVAPSRAALAVWHAGAALPHLSVQVHEYAEVVPAPPPADPPAPEAGPVRVAFVGYPLSQKGWSAFETLAHRLHGSDAYRLFHFAAAPPDPPLPGVESVPARVSPGARNAMTSLLHAHAIQLVLILSPWPETFCLAAYEALAAGADLVALAASGNPADLVLRTGRGVVARDADAMLDFFLNGDAARYAQLAPAARNPRGQLVSRGMTATLPLQDAQPGPQQDASNPPPTPPATDET